MSEQTSSSIHRVLLVAGDPGHRAHLRRILESVLLAVSESSHLEDAVQKLLAHPFAAAVIDPTIPRVDGVELLREIQRLDRNLLHRTIVLVEPGSALAGSLAGFSVCRFLEKPVGRAPLIKTVSECLSLR